MVKWSRVRLVFSILSCEGLLATWRERLQYAPPPRPNRVREGGAQSLSFPRYYDYAGALHVHSTYSDGVGTVSEVAEAANRAGLDYLLLCDHSNLEARQNGEDGWRGRTLVMVGTEVTTHGGHLLALDVPDSFLPSPKDPVAAQKAILESGGVGFVALPCDLKDHWRDFSIQQPGIGLEVFNLSAIARTKINLPALAMIWRLYHGSRPQRAFHLVASRPARELRLWDSLMTPVRAGQPCPRVVGIGSLDAHGVMRVAGRSYRIPTYEETFRTLRTHIVTATPLSYGEVTTAKRKPATVADQALLHRALAAGHCYMAYDNYGDSTGFVFEAAPLPESSSEPQALMGDDITVPAGTAPGGPGGVRLTVRAPRTRSLVRLYHNGRLVAAARGGFLQHRATEPGAYRAEVYLYRRRIGNFCLGAKPWIFSNPIYLQPAKVSAERAAQVGAWSAGGSQAEPVQNP